MSRSLPSYAKLFLTLVGFILLAFILYTHEIEQHESLTQMRQYHWEYRRELAQVGVKQYPVIKSFDRKDWHDYEFINYEGSREGVGEQGKGHELTDSDEIKQDNELEREEGLHVIVSDKISVNRSIQDTRPKR